MARLGAAASGPKPNILECFKTHLQRNKDKWAGWTWVDDPEPLKIDRRKKNPTGQGTLWPPGDAEQQEPLRVCEHSRHGPGARGPRNFLRPATEFLKVEKHQEVYRVGWRGVE